MNHPVNPHRAVSFKESAIRKALETAGSLIADTKYDGVRGCLKIKPIITAEPYFDGSIEATAKVFARSNKTLPALSYFDQFDWARWGDFLSDFMFPTGMMIDGELMVKGETFQKSAGILRRNIPIDKSRLQFVVYGIIPIEAAESPDDYEVPACVMKMHIEIVVARLQDKFPEVEWIIAETEDVFSMDELNELYIRRRAERKEGLIIKDPLGHWKRGKKTGNWKMKPEDTIDGVVQGINWGTSGLSNEGKIIGFEVLLEDGTVCNANGITQAQMEDFTFRHYHLHHGEDALYIGWSVEVKFMERTDDGGLRHPSFSQWRGTESDPTIKI